MNIKYYKDVALEDVNVEGAKNTKIRWLISQKDDAPTFSTRMFEVKKMVALHIILILGNMKFLYLKDKVL